MSTVSSKSDQSYRVKFIRLGGIAILLGLIIHILANVFLKQFPSEDFTPSELKEYLSSEATTWAVVHGIRYLAVLCIIIFSSALFLKTRDQVISAATGWGIVGLLGSLLMMANLITANAVEILAFSDFHNLTEKEDLFWLLFYFSRVLFTAEIATWAIFIFGFSLAGFYSATFPKWLIILGILCSILGMLSAIFIVSIMKNEWAVVLIEISSLTGLLWFVCTGLIMLFQKL